MNFLDRLLAHDHWTTRQLLELSEPLRDAQLDQEFDVGLRTLRATLDPVIWNMEAWTDAMRGRPLRDRGPRDVPAMLARLDGAASDLAELATDVDRRGAWDEQWLDTFDDPPRSRTFGGTIAHVITHSMHHRAQVLFMLRRLGVEAPEGDVLSWEQALDDHGR